MPANWSFTPATLWPRSPLKELAALNGRLKAVFGNCDGEKLGLKMAIEPYGEIQQEPFAFSHAGKEILLCHIDLPVSKYVASGKYDIVIFGHTHKTEVRKQGKTLSVNPGETGGWLTGKFTVALIDPEISWQRKS